MEINNIPHEVSYRNVKYPRIEFKTGKLLLVLPSGFDPEIVLRKHKRWILKKIEFIEDCLKEAENKEIAERKEKEFREIIHSLVERISEEMGEKLITIRLWNGSYLSTGFALLDLFFGECVFEEFTLTVKGQPRTPCLLHQ